MILTSYYHEEDWLKVKALKVMTIIVGVGGLLGQLLLMRELMVTFYGNELTMGVVIAIWLLMEASGAFIGDFLIKFFQRAIPALYSLLLLLYAIALPISLYYSRGINRALFQLLPGETGGLDLLFFSSFLLLSPPAVIHGALYPCGTALLRLSLRKGAAGLIYMYENLGTLLAGLLFTLILAQRFHSISLSLFISLLHLLLILSLLALFQRRPKIFIYGGGVLLFVSLLVVPPLSESLHQQSLQREWRDQELVHYQNTPYGNVVLLQSEGEYTLFYDGRPSMNIPTPDLAKILDYAHLALSSHPDPKRVLLLGGGIGGLIHEILKHPIEELVYVEIDPDLPQILQDLELPLVEEELSHERVLIEITDGRRYLKGNPSEFDLILLDFMVPETLQMNRLFTEEFFTLVRENLREDGLFVFNAPGSPHYLSTEMQLLHGSYYRTAGEVFLETHYLPGELGLFLVSDTDLELDASILYTRLKEREIQVGMLSESYLTYRLDLSQREWMTRMLQDSGARINSDLTPSSFYYTLRYWGTIFTPRVSECLAWLETFDFKYYLALALLLPTLPPLYLRIKREGKRKKRCIFLYAIFTSGFVGMSFDLLLLFLFQSIYGYLYSMSGLLMASFMFGLFWGGQSATVKWVRGRDLLSLKKLFLFGEYGIILLALGCAGIAYLIYPLSFVLPDSLLLAFFILLAVLTAFPVGFQFPLATAFFSREKEEINMAGKLYAVDLLGGFAGGVLISILLFPLLGFIQSMILLTFLKVGSLALLMFYGRVE